MNVQYLTAETIDEFNALKSTLAAVTAELDAIQKVAKWTIRYFGIAHRAEGHLEVVERIRKVLEANA